MFLNVVHLIYTGKNITYEFSFLNFVLPIAILKLVRYCNRGMAQLNELTHAPLELGYISLFDQEVEFELSWSII